MIALIIGTHGEFSRELIESSKMIFGEQENISYITFKPGEGPEELTLKYKNELSKLNTKDGVLFLVDLFGGSPFNAASVMALGDDKMEVVSGVNLPMLLEVFGSRSFSNLEELVNVAVTVGKESIKSFKNGIEKDDDLEEDL